MKSTNKEPSVPAVVLDTMQSIFEEEEEHVAVDHVTAEDKEKETLNNVSAELEKLPRQTSVSEIISNFEAVKEKDDAERQSVSPKISPRRSMSPREIERNRINSSEERSVSEEENEVEQKNEDVVTVSSTAGKTDNTVTVTTNKREMEIQAVKVRIDDDEPVVTSNIDDVITINGQPVPAASTVVINGHVTRIQNTPQRELEKQRSLDKEQGKVRSPEKELDKARDTSKSPVIDKNYRKDSKGYIQQTDLDTFETKITSDAEPSEVSNLDDDSSDQKSDTGSINTVDSVDKEEKDETRVANNKNRKLKGRSVSILVIGTPVSRNLFKG